MTVLPLGKVTSAVFRFPAAFLEPQPARNSAANTASSFTTLEWYLIAPISKAHSPHARHDQVRALHLRSSFRVNGSAAGLAGCWISSGTVVGQAGLDHSGDGRGALGRHGV